MSWYSRDELIDLGIRSIGKDVRVSKGSNLYRPENITIGDHSRIDDFATLTPGPDGLIDIGSHVHIAAYVMIEVPNEIKICDFAGLAARVTVFGGSDNYLGEFLTGPTIPMDLRDFESPPIHIGRHVVVGGHTVILPGSQIGDGSSIGAMSLVRGVLDPFGVYAGIPARRIRDRSKKLLELESEVLLREAKAQDSA